MCEQGRWLQALQLAQTATKIDPVDIWTRLKMAGVLLALDRGEEAREQVNLVKGQEHLAPLVVAQVERMLGRIDLAINSPNYHTSVEHFGEAIRKAMPLIAARSESVQKAALDVLLDAHLGTALAIAQASLVPQRPQRVPCSRMTRVGGSGVSRVCIDCSPLFGRVVGTVLLKGSV